MRSRDSCRKRNAKKLRNSIHPLSVHPYVIMVVGVNGVGKTTTIGKLAYNFRKAGKTVLLGAADTFRAAAVDQLRIWAQRADVPIITQGMGADPASVAYDTVNAAISRNIDVVIIDTAGRLAQQDQPDERAFKDPECHAETDP